jgi:hypothetical protein
MIRTLKYLLALVVLLHVFAAGAVAAPVNKDAVAVIIGNKNYKGRTPEVDFAHNDADAMRKFVVDVLGYRDGNIIDLRDATKSEIEAVFGNKDNPEGKLHDWIRPKRSDVVVFYSGHGVPGQKDKRPYLLAVDGDANRAEITGYPVDVLYKNLAKLPAKSVTVYLDACFSGESPKGMIIRATSGISITPKMPKSVSWMTIITAAQGDQFASWDEKAKHGLFTKHLLDALYGAADGKEYGNGDKKVSVKEIEKYLNEEMTYHAKRAWGRRQIASVRGVNETILASVTTAHAVARNPILVEDMDAKYVSVKTANLRSAPSTNAKIVGSLSKGKSVNVTGRVKDKNWFRLDNGSFVFGSLLATPSELVRTLVQKLDLDSDEAGFSQDRKILKRLNIAIYNKLETVKFERLMRPIIFAAINPLGAGKGCKVPKKKSPWLKYLIGDPKKILAQCSKASNVRDVAAQFSKKKLPSAEQLKKASTNLTAVGRFSIELKKKYASMSGVNKAHKNYLTAAADVRELLNAGASYVKLANQVNKEGGLAERRKLLRKAKKQALLLGFDSKGTGEETDNLMSYTDAKNALKNVPGKPISREKLNKWLKNKNIRQDQVVLRSLQLVEHYMICMGANFLEQASGCQKFNVFPNQTELSKLLNVSHMNTNVQKHITDLIITGWDGIRLDPDYRGDAIAYFGTVFSSFPERASAILHPVERIFAENMAAGRFGKAEKTINSLFVEIQSIRNWIEFGRCKILERKLATGSLPSLNYKVINSRFSRTLDVFADPNVPLSTEKKYQYLSQCSETTIEILNNWLDRYFISLCTEIVTGYDKHSSRRIGYNADKLNEQLNFSIMDVAITGNEHAQRYQEYFGKKVKFFQKLELEDFEAAETLLDKDEHFGCLGGPSGDREAFQNYVARNTSQ